MRKGIRSTSHDSNRRSAEPFLSGLAKACLRAELLFDPQTCGGLLMGIDPSNTENFKEAMSNANLEVHIIGKVNRSYKQSLELC